MLSARNLSPSRPGSIMHADPREQSHGMQTLPEFPAPILRGISCMVPILDNAVAKIYKLEKCLFKPFLIPLMLED
jgi:hypothetical protein